MFLYRPFFKKFRLLKKPLLFLAVIFTFVDCGGIRNLSSFSHNINSQVKPWSKEIPKENHSNFTFAIISDLNGGERDGIYDMAVDQLNQLQPKFVLSIGDLINGGTENRQQLLSEWESFDKRTAALEMPFFYLGGNHDLTNLEMRDVWQKRYGQRYYHFLYKDVLFLMIDSEDFEDDRMTEIYRARAEALDILHGKKEGNYEDTEYYDMIERKFGAMGVEQFQYFSKVLEDHPNPRWTFVLMHKPLYLRQDQKGLSNLENILKKRPYTVFNGHFHRFQHQYRNGRDYIMLGTTGGEQKTDDLNAFDHITLVKVTDEPLITHLRMDGILDKTGKNQINKRNK